MYSGGLCSWAAAARVVGRFGPDEIVLLFTDTSMEDEDLYRFLDETAAAFGVPVTRIADGRTPWEVFRDKRFLGNPRVDPCSRVLKRELARTWVKEHCAPEDTLLYFGYDFSEAHRLERTREAWEPYQVDAPCLWEPVLDRVDMQQMLCDARISLPRLYEMGFPHNNCGGFCIKAGMSHFVHLYRTMPERYAYHEEQEQALRDMLGDVSILRDRRGGGMTPLPLSILRERIEAGETFRAHDWGGCGCFVETQ
jgi:hypothetical protein